LSYLHGLFAQLVAWLDVSLWEHQTSIDHDVTVAHADQHAVHTDLSQTTDRQNAQWRAAFRRWSREVSRL
jgi:hypothetical protein